jgi:hypothetical protein
VVATWPAIQQKTVDSQVEASQNLEFTLDISNVVFFAATPVYKLLYSLYHFSTVFPFPASIKIYLF